MPRWCRIKSHLHLRLRPPQGLRMAGHGWLSVHLSASPASVCSQQMVAWFAAKITFPRPTGLNHGGALSISRHLADLVISVLTRRIVIETDHTTLPPRQAYACLRCLSTTPSAPTTVDSRHLSSCPKQQSVETVVDRHGRWPGNPWAPGRASRLLGREPCSANNPEAAPEAVEPRTTTTADHGRKSHVFLN